MSSVCSTLVEEGRVASTGGMSLIKDGRRGLGPVCVWDLPQGGVGADSKCITGWWRGGEWLNPQKGGAVAFMM